MPVNFVKIERSEMEDFLLYQNVLSYQKLAGIHVVVCTQISKDDISFNKPVFSSLITSSHLHTTKASMLEFLDDLGLATLTSAKKILNCE